MGVAAFKYLEGTTKEVGGKLGADVIREATANTKPGVRTVTVIVANTHSLALK